MDLFALAIIFVLLLILMSRGLPLSLAMGASTILGFFLFRIPPAQALGVVYQGVFSRTTLNLVLAFYTITYLQRMLEEREHLHLAESSLTRLFGSRRINAMIAPFVIGLLPSVGAVLIARPIVDNAAQEDLTVEERCFVTSFYRHISEIFLPTYGSIILAMEFSGVDMASFVFAMLPLVFLLFFLGFVFYVRKIPPTKAPTGVDKKREGKNIFISLWAIALSIVLILSFNIPVHLAILPVIILSVFINRFKWKEIRPLFRSAFQGRLILTTLAIMVFKELLTFSGVIYSLPELFSNMPLSPVIIFGLIFFVGTLMAGAQAMIATMLPLAVATLGSSLGLIVFLMSLVFIANQVTPIHVCLGVITEAYKLPFTSLVKKTLPVLLSFVIISSLYSYLLFFIFN
ncbi:MAG TPA: DUF401 family protein [Clostridia bacterium]|nr:DUF401 family protein [Clostridia bacterium]